MTSQELISVGWREAAPGEAVGHFLRDDDVPGYVLSARDAWLDDVPTVHPAMLRGPDAVWGLAAFVNERELIFDAEHALKVL